MVQRFLETLGKEIMGGQAFMEYTIKTSKAEEFIDITNLVEKEVKDKSIVEGIVHIFVPHTTAGVTINENADPDVIDDILLGLKKAFPESTTYKHIEGNSTAHIKTSVMGSSVFIIVEQEKLKLGVWQGVYLCEFDGPRNRKVYIKTIQS